MDFVLNKSMVVIDSDGQSTNTIESTNCRVEFDPQSKEAHFFEERNGEYALTVVQPWDCLPDGSRTDFTSEEQCVTFYKNANQHIELEGN